MSGEELMRHLFRLLYDGAEGWNNWRKDNLDIQLDFSGQKFEGALAGNLYDLDFSNAKFIGANLSSANLRGTNFNNSELWDASLNGADLHGTNFTGAILIRASLAGTRGAVLSRANLSGADLSHSEITGNLTGINISGAKCDATIFLEANLQRAHASTAIFNRAVFNKVSLVGASLMGTNFSLAEFIDVDFTDATIGFAIFADNDLSKVRGLDTLNHRMPSTIGIDTIYRSKGKIPEVFLRSCGVPESFIIQMHALVTSTEAIQFYSCFISYSSKDQDFAERLYDDLQNKGVRSWFAPEDLKIGDKIRDRIDESIRLRDKLLLILSEHSITSDWVEHEVESALEEERKHGRTILFPIRLDDAVMDSSKAWAALIRRTRHIGDFRVWKNHDSYQKSFDRLLRDLKAEQS
jgi:uncharacterized protein YjbI with pentapeptide repeats